MLEKVLAGGQRAVVLAGSEERAEALNAALWIYDDRSFLPHGSAKEGFGPDQPIWLALREENPNGATMLVTVDGAAPSDAKAWPSICAFFDGRDEAMVAVARERWKRWKADGHTLKYFKQTDRGSWELAG